MYNFMLMSVVLIFIASKGVCNAGNGTFWHISDVHVDQNYSSTGDPDNYCRKAAEGQPSGAIGLYGNFLCDSPQILVNITVENMKTIEPVPDFIIWTGDNLPHVHHPTPGWSTTYEALNNVTNILLLNFPGIKIFPCIGNHDSYPPNDLPPQLANDSIYTDYLEKGGWNKTAIPPSSWSTFKIGGYYSAQIMQGLRLISLNTILWYKPNELVPNMTDPANQFQWLENELQNAGSLKEKVYIIGHVAPGFYNKVQLPLDPMIAITYYPNFLEKYLNITEKYYSTIAGQFFGHLHIDTFRLFQFNKGVPKTSALLASSVTPWFAKGLSWPVNPSVRLMRFNTTNSSLNDYDQYYLNLTKANELNETQKPEYELLYTFTKAYGVPDLSTASLNKVYEDLKKSNETYKRYIHYLTAAKDSGPCNGSCKTAELCSISCTSQEEYEGCMQIFLPTVTPGEVTTLSPVPAPSSHKTLYAVMGTLIVILVLVSLVAFLRLRRKGPHAPGQYQRFLEF